MNTIEILKFNELMSKLDVLAQQKDAYIYPSHLIANFNIHFTAHLKRFSIEKSAKCSKYSSIFLNQNVSIACNLYVKISYLQVRWVYLTKNKINRTHHT